MATAPRLELDPFPRSSRHMANYQEKCRCGHFRYEHHSSWGCMQWDERRQSGWCRCDGFMIRMAQERGAALG